MQPPGRPAAPLFGRNLGQKDAAATANPGSREANGYPASKGAPGGVILFD
jgi:hypothetical protein